MLATAKVFTNGHSQAIRLPKAFRVDVDEMWIARNEVTGEADPVVKLIDFAHPERNQFHAINQFRIDSNPATGFADTAGHEIMRPELAPDLSDVNGPVLVGEARIPRDDRVHAQRRQR